MGDDVQLSASYIFVRRGDNLRILLEKIIRKLGFRRNLVGRVLLNDGINIVLAIVFCIATDGFKSGETGRRCCVGVYVNYLAALDVLKKSHRRVPSIVLHHFSVLLALANIVRGMLEYAALPIVAFGWIFQEILAN